MTEKQIVYVLSTNYAGSHFLALQLGSHSKCASIGEFHVITRTSKGRRQACSVCDNDEKCPVFKGLHGLPHEKLYHYLFKNLEQLDPEVHTVIDNSKMPRWARRFVNLPGIRKKFIHLVRDPRSFIRRMMLRYKTPKSKIRERIRTTRHCWRHQWWHSWDAMTGNEVNVYIRRWLYQNRLITNFINRNNLDAHILTYYDLVFNTDEILSGLMNWLGLTYEKEQKQYWKFEHHGTNKQEYFCPPKNGEKRFDQRWKDFLDDKSKQEAVMHTNILNYLDEIDLHLEDSGITSNHTKKLQKIAIQT